MAVVCEESKAHNTDDTARYNDHRRIAFIFPTAGAQEVGMGAFLADYGKRPFEEAGAILGVDLQKVCMEGPDELLDSAHFTNTAIYAQSIATYEILTLRGIIPDVVTGYSLGEYSALCAAGVYDFKRGLRFLYDTSEQYQALFPNGRFGMAAVVDADRAEVEAICKDIRDAEGPWIFVSNINCKGQEVISGKRDLIELVEGRLSGGRLIQLSVNVPSHTPLVKQAEDIVGVEKYIDKLLSHNLIPILPVVSTVTGSYASTYAEVRENLSNHLSSPVQWEKAVETMIDDGARVFIELGPGSLLNYFVKIIASSKRVSVQTHKTSNQEELEKVLQIYAA